MHKHSSAYDNSHTDGYTEHVVDIHPHAMKAHGITRQQIESAIISRIGVAKIRSRDAGAEPPRWAAVGFDAQLRPIELVYVQTSDAPPLVIHANYLTKGFYEEWRKA